ncbi:MAG: Gx transporter family protein [Halanaerobiales bacterium]|nr:Gx transporter family protein [Halanaerobiales bacterium]
MRTRKVVIISLLVGLGLVLHLVENMIPLSFLIPGAKLGLANIANLLGLILFGFFAGLQILLLRIFLGSILAGTFMTINFYLSLSGGLLGYLIMSLLFYYLRDKFSIIGVSLGGAVFHNLGQIVTAYFIISNTAIFYYLPYLILLAIPTGIGIGLVTIFTYNYLPRELKRIDV